MRFRRTPNSVLAWHFTKGYWLRDGQPLVVGKTYRFNGRPSICIQGLHASRHLSAAMYYLDTLADPYGVKLPTT